MGKFVGDSQGIQFNNTMSESEIMMKIRSKTDSMTETEKTEFLDAALYAMKLGVSDIDELLAIATEAVKKDTDTKSYQSEEQIKILESMTDQQLYELENSLESAIDDAMKDFSGDSEKDACIRNLYQKQGWTLRQAIAACLTWEQNGQLWDKKMIQKEIKRRKKAKTGKK